LRAAGHNDTGAADLLKIADQRFDVDRTSRARWAREHGGVVAKNARQFRQFVFGLCGGGDRRVDGVDA
jgi:hypothetical protein